MTHRCYMSYRYATHWRAMTQSETYSNKLCYPDYINCIQTMHINRSVVVIRTNIQY